MRSQTSLSNAFITAGISLCTNKRWALGWRSKHFEPSGDNQPPLWSWRNASALISSGKLRLQLWALAGSAVQQRSSVGGGVRRSPVSLGSPQTARPPGETLRWALSPHGEGEQLKSTTATNVGWRFGTRVNRSQNLGRLGRSLLTPIISAPMEAFYFSTGSRRRI